MMNLIIPWWGRALAIVALIAAVWAHGYVKGEGHVEHQQELLRASEQAVMLEGVQRAAKIADHVVYQYMDRWHTVVTQGQTIIKEVPKYVTVEADAKCAIPAGFVRVLNAAATNVAPMRADIGARRAPAPPAGADPAR